MTPTIQQKETGKNTGKHEMKYEIS